MREVNKMVADFARGHGIKAVFLQEECYYLYSESSRNIDPSDLIRRVRDCFGLDIEVVMTRERRRGCIYQA